MRYFIINLILFISFHIICDAVSPSCWKAKDKTQTWIRILTKEYKSDTLHLMGNYEGDSTINWGLKKLWVPCGDSKKEYMVVGKFKRIYNNQLKIQRTYNNLLWVAVFRKGHQLANLGGQWLSLYFDCFNLRANLINRINKREDIYEYEFPKELRYDNDCSYPYLIEFSFFELKNNISKEAIIEKCVCSDDYRVFMQDFPIKNIEEITEEALGVVSLAYCTSNGGPSNKEKKNKSLDDVIKYIKMCKATPFKEPVKTKAETPLEVKSKEIEKTNQEKNDEENGYPIEQPKVQEEDLIKDIKDEIKNHPEAIANEEDDYFKSETDDSLQQNEDESKMEQMVTPGEADRPKEISKVPRGENTGDKGKNNGTQK